MNEKILFVDDEASVLDGYRRVLRLEFSLTTALSGEQGLATIKATGPYAVVVSDMRMPGMNGAEFLAQVRQRAPDSVRILLTGHADLDSAIDAVNKGNIFRFLTKPCEKQVLVDAIHSALEKFRERTAQKDLVKRAQLVARSKSEWDNADIQPVEKADGPAGLPGPDEARAHLAERFHVDPHCFALIVKLNLLTTVEERYGGEAATRYLGEAVQFLLRALQPADRLFHWSKAVFLAVLERQVSPGAVRMEVTRLLQEPPQHVLDVNGRRTMIAIATSFDLLPVVRFNNFDEMLAAFDAMLVGKL
ncbi:MAG: response regulator [Terracidiphilus sp.]